MAGQRRDGLTGDDKNGVLFCAFLLEIARKTNVSPGRKKVSFSKPTEKWVDFIIGQRTPLSPTPNKAYCMAPPTIRALRAYNLDSLEKVRSIVINSLEKVRFPR